MSVSVSMSASISGSGSASARALVSAPWVCSIVAPPIADGAVVLGGPDGRTVLACGRRLDLRRDLASVPERRATGALLPGLVNAHTHLELSAFASNGPIPGGAGVIPWTRALMAARASERCPSGAAAESAAATAAARSARAFGTVALGDVGNGTSGWQAMIALGFRGRFFHELVGSREVATGDAIADAAQQRLAAGLAAGLATLASDHRAVAAPADLTEVDPNPVAAVPAPHAPYSVGPALLRRIFAVAAATGQPTSIHLAEDVDELLLLRDGGGAWPAILRALGVPDGERVPGLGPTAYLARLGAFETPSAPPLLVHMVHADDDDLRRARAAGATIVLCPRSNLHIGGRLPDLPAMVQAGVRLALGTDSLASVDDLSPWQEMAALARHFPAIAPGVWLRAATHGGAIALGLGAGAFLPAASPGVLDVSLPEPCNSPEAVERTLVSTATPTVSWISAA